MRISSLTTSFSLKKQSKQQFLHNAMSFKASNASLNQAYDVFDRFNHSYIAQFCDDVSDLELNLITSFAQDNPQCVDYYWAYIQQTDFKEQKQKDNLLNLTSLLSRDDQKLDVYSKMSSCLNRFLLNPAQILVILDKEPEKLKLFFDEMYNRTANLRTKFEYIDSSNLINTIDTLDLDTIIPYFNMIDYSIKKNKYFTTAPIEFFVNPKTKKFDKNIAKLALSFPIKYESFKGYDIVQNCIDLKTGKASKQVISFVSDILNFNNKQKYNHAFVYGWNGEGLKSFIESLRSSDGSFDKKNISYAKKLLQPVFISNEQYFPVEVSGLAHLINFSKNEVGEIDDEKFNSTLRYVIEMKSYNRVSQVLESIDKCNKAEQKKLFDLLKKYLPEPNIVNNSFCDLVDFCILKDGSLDKNSVDFIKKMSLLDNLYFSESFLKIAKAHPESNDIIFELVRDFNLDTLKLYKSDFIDEIQNENGEISSLDKNRIRQFLDKFNNTDEFVSLHKACAIIKDGKIIGFDDELFDEVLKIIPALKNEKYQYIDTKILSLLISGNLDYSSLMFKDKKALLDDLSKVQNKFGGCEIFDNVIKEINEGLRSNIKPIEISKEAKFEFIKNILSSKMNSHTPFEEKITSLIPQMEKMSVGFTLNYPRDNYIQDLAKLCGKSFNKYCDKLGIIPIGNNSYDGIIQLQKLNLNDSYDKKVYELSHKFLYENSFDTGDEEFDFYLNILTKAMPEFINIVNKKQHLNQKHTLDVHVLLALAYALKNPNYIEKLSLKDRAILKFSILFHDLSKKDGVVDSTHPQTSALWMKNISSKIFESSDVQDRIYEFILNHHWSKEFNVPDKSKIIDKLAFKFRRPNDFAMAKIMAEADMKAVSSKIYQAYSGCLKDEGISNIEKAIEFYNSNGNAIISHKIVHPSKLKNYLVNYQDRTFPLIDLTVLNEDDNVDVFGFKYGLKKKDLKFLVHMVSENNLNSNLNSISLLANPINAGVLSESLITPYKKATFSNRKFGVLLSSKNHNIVSMFKSNCGTGTKKDINDVLSTLSLKRASQRAQFKENLLFHLGIDKRKNSDIEFSIFYKKYLSDDPMSKIKSTEEYSIGEFNFDGDKFHKALNSAIEDFITKNDDVHNEIVSYSPQLEGVIAKCNSLNELPLELIDFAVKKNLPVILI